MHRAEPGVHLSFAALFLGRVKGRKSQLTDYPAVLEIEDAVRPESGTHIVSYHKDALTLPVEAGHQVKDLGSVPAVERAVAATGTPYFVLGVNKPATDGCVGSAPIDIDSALPGVLVRLRERNVRSLVQMGIRQMDLMDSDALRGACESYEELAGWPKHVKRVTQEDIVRAAYDFFHERYRTKAGLPDAFLFTDDYLARGALLALLAADIRTGRDVLVITFANKGTTPLHPDPVDFVLSDPARNADVLADALVAYLQSGVAPGTIALENTFMAGGY